MFLARAHDQKPEHLCPDFIFITPVPYLHQGVSILCSPGALEVKYGKVYGEQEINSLWSLERPYHLN